MEYIFDGEQLEAKHIGQFVERFEADRKKLHKNYQYYTANVRVEKLRLTDDGADNRVNANLAKYITDVATGYFIGLPAQYVSDEEQVEPLQLVLDANDEMTVNYEIAENMSIAGVGYDVVYIDDAKNIRFCAVDPCAAFLVVDDTIEKNVLAGVRVWTDSKGKRRGEIYRPQLTQTFEGTGSSLRVIDEFSTPFKRVPMTQYKNNRHMSGDFEPVKTLIDAYNKTLSNVSDDLENTAAAYLALSGFDTPDEEDKKFLRETRIIAMPPDGKMEYVVKNLDDGVIENHKKTLRREILQIACVPDLTDESFAGSASGVALRYKLWGIDQLFGKKRSGMEKGLFNRLQLIADALSAVKNLEIGDISMSVSIKFVANMPKDKTVDIEDAVKVAGMVSEQTVHEMLAPATGVRAEDEAARMEKETHGDDQPDYEEAFKTDTEPETEETPPKAAAKTRSKKA